MRRVFIVLIMASTSVVSVQSGPRNGDPQPGIALEVNRAFGSILVRAQVNGRPATLIVDTGSSHTIFSSELLQVQPLARADIPAKGSGYVGSARWAKATVELGDLTWHDRQILVMDDFREISNSMKQRVDGILGEDILREFDSVVIDFKHDRLFLLRSVSSEGLNSRRYGRQSRHCKIGHNTSFLGGRGLSDTAEMWRYSPTLLQNHSSCPRGNVYLLVVVRAAAACVAPKTALASCSRPIARAAQYTSRNPDPEGGIPQ